MEQEEELRELVVYNKVYYVNLVLDKSYLLWSWCFQGQLFFNYFLVCKLFIKEYLLEFMNIKYKEQFCCIEIIYVLSRKYCQVVVMIIFSC